MKIEVNGNSVTLNKTDFLSHGGEGSVYVKGGTAYKIYHNVNKMIPIAKIQELSCLDLPRIINPQNVIYDKSVPIGYTMRFVKDTHPLCKLFTKAFKQRNNLSFENIFDLVKLIQDGVQFIHDKKILVVDLNELNFLVSEKFDDVFFIDVDSYQTKSFPATAIMESIRDRHSKKFSEVTDWFSWGVVTFQMLIGIHPYKGKHSINDLDERMCKNISVFNKNVSMPSICEPINKIPEAYRNWYKAIFEEGKRLLPPTSLLEKIIVSAVTKNIHGSNLFDINLLYSVDEDIFDVYYGSDRYIITNSKATKNKGIEIGKPDKIVSTINNDYMVHLSYNKVEVSKSNKKNELQVSFKKAMEYEGRLYLQDEDKICELIIKEMGENFVCSLVTVANIMPNSTTMFDGVVLQNILGEWFASIPFASQKCKQVQIKELRSCKVIEAKLDRNIMMVVVHDGKQYNKLIFCFDDVFERYELQEEKNISNMNLNFVILENNVCVHLNDKDELELFAAKYKHSLTKKVLQDPILNQNMILVKQGTSCQFYSDKNLYSIKIK